MTQLGAFFSYVWAAAAAAIIRRFQFLPSPSQSQDKINAHPTHKTRKREKERSLALLEDGRQACSSIGGRTHIQGREIMIAKLAKLQPGRARQRS